MKAYCKFDKSKNVTLVLFYLVVQICCLEGSVEVYVDTFPVYLVLLSQFSHYEGKAVLKVGDRVSPDITSRCWLDWLEPEPWSRAWV